MKESVKATLWSVFIFPGAGHFYLRKWLTGSLSAAIAVAVLTVILERILQRANQIAEQIVLGEIPFDLAIIMQKVSQQSATADSTLDIAGYVLAGIWLFAAMDAFRLGRAIDNRQTESE